MPMVWMPQLGISEESAVLTAWYVKRGDAVRAGDKLFSIETGKSSFDVECEDTGVVLELFAAEGDEVAVKAPVCAVGAPDEAAGGVSPRAEKLAKKLDIDPKNAIPTGPEGRVIERDVRGLAESEGDGGRPQAAPAAAYTDRPLSNMRTIIAAKMLASLRNTAQLTHTASFDAANILACRGRLKGDPHMAGVTLGDMILYAVSRTLPDFPALNAHLLDGTLRTFKEVNLAVAVDTERGLMAPVILGASGLTLLELSAQGKALAEQCRAGSVNPDLLTGGSFTVSNLGQYGTESFTPILNAPQTGILGVNTIQQRVKVADGCIGAYPAMTLSLTYDHRALDGAPASRFLQTLCKILEDFSL